MFITRAQCRGCTRFDVYSGTFLTEFSVRRRIRRDRADATTGVNVRLTKSAKFLIENRVKFVLLIEGSAKEKQISKAKNKLQHRFVEELQMQ